MNKISFFYSVEDVFNTSVKALKKRDYKILETDESSGTIKARYKKGVLNPAITVEMKVEKVSDTQSELKIISDAQGGFLASKNFEAKAEQKLMDTLYRLFETI